MGLETATVIAIAQIGASLVASTALNLLRKNPKQDLRDFSNEHEGEDAPIQKGYGPRAVTQPKVVWKRRRDDHDSDGLARYRAHAMLALGEARRDGAALQLERLWHGDKPIYSTQPDLDLTSNLLSITRYEQKEFIPAVGIVVTTDVFMDIESPPGGPDLSRYKSGPKAVISGAGETGNNGTFPVVRTLKSASDGVTTMRLRNEDCVDEAAGADIRVFQALPNFSLRDMRSLTFFNGNAQQVPSTFIEQFEGEGNVEAFHGLVCLLVDKLRLNDTGGSIQPFRCVYSADAEDVPMAEVVEEIALEAPYVDSSMIDVSGVSGTIRGFTTNPDQTPNEKLEVLNAAYGLLSQERDGKRYFFTRDNAVEYEIPLGDLGVHEIGDQPTDFPFTRMDPGSVEVPSRITINFFDEDQNYAPGSVTEHQSDTDNTDELVLDLPIVLTRAQATAIAARIKWIIKANRQRVAFTVGPKHLRIQENDVAVITADDGREWKILLDSVDRGADEIIRCEGVVEDASVLEAFPRGADDPLDRPRDIYIPPYLQLAILDFAPLDNERLDQPGIRWATAAADPNAQFAQAVLYASVDGVEYTPIDYSSSEITMGQAITQMTSGTPGLWDEDSVLRVAITHGELTSASRQEVLTLRKNWCAFGSEVGAFRNADLVSSNSDVLVYDLSGWLRGLRNTAASVSNHSAVERFVMIDQQVLPFVPIDIAVGQTMYFKGVPVDGDPEDFPALPVTFQAENVQPFAPWDLRGDRRESTLVVDGTWLMLRRRTRALTPFLGAKGLVEPEERYQFRILDSAGMGGGNIIYEREVVGTDRMFFARTIQENLGLTYGDPIGFRARQWSEVLQAWGHEAEGVA